MKNFIIRILIGCVLIAIGGGIALYAILRATTFELEWQLRPREALDTAELAKARSILEKRIEILKAEYSLNRWNITEKEGGLRLQLEGRKNFHEIVPKVCPQGLVQLRLAKTIPEGQTEPPDGFEPIVFREKMINLMNLQEPVTRETPLWVKKEPEFSCAEFKDTRYETQGLKMDTVVTLKFLEADSKKFAEVTAAHTGELLTVFMDGSIQVAAKITGRVDGGVVQLKGIRLRAKARQLASFLKLGALPCDFEPVKLEDKGEVGPDKP